MRNLVRLFLACIVAFPLLAAAVTPADGEKGIAEVRQLSPGADQRIYDYGGMLKLSPEPFENLLKQFRQRFSTDVFLVTVSSLQGERIQEAASNLLSTWNIGRELSARGILVLIAKQEKLVKVEVGYGAEPTYTDLFCGYIERKRLKPYVENDQLDAGVAAMFEEFLGRASGKLTDSELNRRMPEYLSGGAGITKPLAAVQLRDHSVTDASAPERTFATPEAVWAEYVQDLKACKTSRDLYTPLSQMVWEFSRAMSKEVCATLYQGHSQTPQIFKDGNFAVAHVPSAAQLGARFIANTDRGWKFDMWSTRNWIHFNSGGAKSPWYLMGKNHPYFFAFRQPPLQQFLNSFEVHDDYLYLNAKQLSTVPQTRVGFLGLIETLQTKTEQKPDNVNALLDLGEAYFDLGAEFRATETFQKALKLRANDPRALRGLGLAYRDIFLSLDTAISYLKPLVEVNPKEANDRHYYAIALWRKAAQARSQDDYRKALSEMEIFTELASVEQKTEGYDMIAFLAEKVGEREKQVNALIEHVKLAPFDPYAQKNLYQAGGKPAVERFLKIADGRSALLITSGPAFSGGPMIVLNVNPEGPSAAAGVQRGDILVSFQGIPLTSSGQFINLIGEQKPGTITNLEIRRRGVSGESSMTLHPVTISLAAVLRGS